MFKFKKGDQWKAVILIMLIILVFAFIYNTYKTNFLVPSSASGVSKKPVKEEVVTVTKPSGKKMFTPLPPISTAELRSAASAKDPFRPKALITPGGTSAPSPSSAAGPSSLGLSSSISVSDLRFGGVITSAGRPPLAILTGGNEHYFVHLGEILPGGWKVMQIESDGLILASGGERITLTRNQNLPQPAR